MTILFARPVQVRFAQRAQHAADDAPGLQGGERAAA
jgi:hypothetical protein